MRRGLHPAFLLANGLANQSGEVGKNLTIHPASRVAALFDEDIDGWRGVPQGYMVDEFKDEGIMLEGAQGPPDLIGPGLPFVGAEFKKLVSNSSGWRSSASWCPTPAPAGCGTSAAGR